MSEAQVASVPKVGAQKERPRSPLSGAPLPRGRQKGTPNKVTRTIREAVERAARDCHPAGLAGWLIERANGGIADRQIFAGLVSKVIPLQVKTSVEGGIKIQLGWLGQRAIGATTAQVVENPTQVIDLTPEADGSYRIVDPQQQAMATAADRAAGSATAQEGAGGDGNAAPTSP